MLLLHVSLWCARVSVTCVKMSIRIFVPEVSLYRVVTCLCTHCAWCVVLPLVLLCLFCSWMLAGLDWLCLYLLFSSCIIWNWQVFAHKTVNWSQLREECNMMLQYNITKLTSWSWALLEKPPVVKLLRNLPAIYGTRRFIIVFTRALHWSLSWARSIQYITPHPISVRSILLLSTNLILGLPA
jgi:hypothetical protein